MAVDDRLTGGLFGSIVAVVTAPTGIGAALGGWLAARRTRTARGSVLAGAATGLAAAGGLLAGAWSEVGTELREELSDAV
jgi:hypothetical protein